MVAEKSFEDRLADKIIGILDNRDSIACKILDTIFNISYKVMTTWPTILVMLISFMIPIPIYYLVSNTAGYISIDIICVFWAALLVFIKLYEKKHNYKPINLNLIKVTKGCCEYTLVSCIVNYYWRISKIMPEVSPISFEQYIWGISVLEYSVLEHSSSFHSKDRTHWPEYAKLDPKGLFDNNYISDWQVRPKIMPFNNNYGPLIIDITDRDDVSGRTLFGCIDIMAEENGAKVIVASKEQVCTYNLTGVLREYDTSIGFGTPTMLNLYDSIKDIKFYAADTEVQQYAKERGFGDIPVMPFDRWNIKRKALGMGITNIQPMIFIA